MYNKLKLMASTSGINMKARQVFLRKCSISTQRSSQEPTKRAGENFIHHLDLGPFEMQTRTCRPNKTTINIMGKHSRRKGREWCKASFNFSAKLPIDRNSAEVIFRMSTSKMDLCVCGELAASEFAVQPAAGVFVMDADETSNDSGFGSTASSCKTSDDNPCGRSSTCIHVRSAEECDNETCPAGDFCQNQKLRQRDFPMLRVTQTADRRRGVVCITDIPEQTVVTEYIGDLINQKEVNRRKKMPGLKGFYLFKVTRGRFIDGELAGDLSRYINHSCEPNCFSKKINVAGNIRTYEQKSSYPSGA